MSSRRAAISSPASASSPTLPSNTRSQNRRRARGSSSVRRTWFRKISAKRASRPIAAGNARSISARSLRASAGAESAGRDGDRDRPAIDDRRHDEAREGGTVDHVHRHALRLGKLRDPRLQRLVGGRDDDQCYARQVSLVEGPAGPADAGVGDELGDLAGHRFGDQRYLRTGRQQELDLARRVIGAADDQHTTTLQRQE